jgi:acetyl esterase/lipase/outer membrane protein assembly factor BamB
MPLTRSRLMLALCLCLCGAAASPAAEAPAFTRTEDVIYGRKPGLALTMDIFRPKEHANGAAIILVVSGGWVSGHDWIDPMLKAGFMAEYLKRGYTVFAVVHGSQPQYTIPEILGDMHRAVRFIRYHAGDYHIDPDRIGITGGSAGGHLSLMQGTAGDRGNPKAPDPVDRTSSRVQAVACFFPPTDFLNYGKKGEIALGCGILKDFRAPFDFREFDQRTHAFERITDVGKILGIGRQISPVYHANAETPPTLIVHGDADNLVPIQQAQLMTEKLKQLGVPAKLIPRKGKGHGWPNWEKDNAALADWFDKYLAKAKTGAGWPQFRGPGSRGVAAGRVPDSWGPDRNVVWKTPIPGRGWSSPVVWADRVFVTAVVSEGKLEAPRKGLYFGGERLKPPADVHRWVVYCVDAATGKICWERTAHKGVPQSTHHLKNSYASETPLTDGKRLYAYFGSVGVFCYDQGGKELWTWKAPAYPTKYGWGTAASPALHKDRLYVVDDNEKHSFLIALDTAAGKEVWRVDRDEKTNWATPFVWENARRTEIVTAGAGRVRSYDLNGKLLWELKGMSVLTIPTPFAHDGLLYVTSGYVLDAKRPLYAIRPGAAGDISLKKGEDHNAFVAWCQPTGGPYNPTPVAYGPYVYVLYDRGFLACYDARTGKEVYGRQRLGSATAFTASPWAGDGKVFCLSEDGETFVVQAGPEFKLLGRNRLDEMALASPAPVAGGLILRTDAALYRIGIGAAAAR